MSRFFSVIAILSAFMVLLAGAGSYWLSEIKVRNSEIALTTVKAQGLANNLGLQLDTLQQSVNGIAHIPEVIAALNTADPVTLNNVAKKLQVLIPGALKVRLLLPSTNEIDTTQTPHMGFGDLEMVQATLKSKQKPVIQGEGEHRHLALTSLVNMNDHIIGVVLVSFKTDILNQAVQSSNFGESYAEIMQDQIILATNGDAAAKQSAPGSLSFENGRWIINFWAKTKPDFNELILITSITIIPILLTCLIFFIGYRKLAELMLQDQQFIVKAIKDILTDKNLGNYPIQLAEMKPIIVNILQFKRALQDKNPIINQNQDILDDGYDVRFLEGKPLKTNRMISPSKKNKSISPHVKTEKPETSQFANIFRCYDIRGIVGKELTEEVVTNIGRAVASEAKEQGINSIVIGRDGRLSSPDLAAALISGICASGCNVEDIGLVPTPLLYFVAHHKDGRSGIMITGSHNPSEYNGLKIVLNNETLAEGRIQAIKQRIESRNFNHDEPGSSMLSNSFVDEYIGTICEDIRISKPIKVVVDCGNGAASELAPKLLKALGCEVIELFCTIDGEFPNHHPDPSKAENMADLITTVKQEAADIGIAFDGDGDRLGIVDSEGKIIWPDRQMMVFARNVLSRKPSAKILYDVKCSKHLDDQIRKFGGQPIMWKTGHSLLKAKLKETGAALAGEMSGHIFFNDRWLGFDDALYAAARMIEIVAEDSRSSAELFAEYPDSINTPELNIPMEEGENVGFIEQMCKRINFKDGKIITIDGLRVEFSDGWGLVRSSNTTPSIVVRFEADSKIAMNRIQRKFKFLMLQIKPDLSLPF
ncbi:phosphomannomutase/phosphoglucomutase [Methylomonas sp. AM2-LC]|uniref:phosphomannomutase/phosphoglucomutase n=1 Tax=Methylomonas sp. AM2-LC TaxID=3153301 RepID=UPI003264C09A